MSLRFGNFISLNPSNPHHPPIPSGPPLWHGATLDSDLLRCIAVTMGRKRSSLSSGLKYTDIENTKMGKGKKRRRDSVPGVVTTPDAARDSEPRALPGGSRTDSSKSVVLQRAPEDSVNPILVSFANQTVPADVESLQFTVQHGEGKGREGEKVVMSEGPRVDYWGLNFGPGSESLDLCRYLVGVEDKETGVMTLHEAGHAYALRQSVAGREESVEDNAMEGVGWKQRKDALVNQFGSKKKRAAIRARDANVIEADAIVGGGALSRVLGRALKEAGGLDEAAGGSSTVKDGAAASVEEARRRFLPPMRPEASTPEGVYAASDIAGEEELEAMGRHIDRAAGKCQGGLQQWAKEFAEKPRDKCPQFVATRLTLLPHLGDKPKQRWRLLQLLYLRHMCVFHRAPDRLRGTPSSLAANLDVPEVVLRRLLEKFTVREPSKDYGSNYYRTKTLKSQLLVYTLCLALVLEGCRLEFGVLAQDIRLAEAETRALFRELGCAAIKTTAQLKLPLVFPRSRKAPRS